MDNATLFVVCIAGNQMLFYSFVSFLSSCRTWLTFSDRTATQPPLPPGSFLLLVFSTSSACGVGVGDKERTRASTTFQVCHLCISVHGAKIFVYSVCMIDDPSVSV